MIEFTTEPSSAGCSAEPASSHHWPEKRDLMGVQISCVDYPTAVDQIVQAARTGQRAIVSCFSVHALVTASRNRPLREQVNRFAMITPDGQPVRWALNLLYRVGLRDRVYGPELTLRVCEAAEQHRLPVYLYGATDETLAKLDAALCSRYPQLQIVGKHAPPFRALSEQENHDVCDAINRSGARILLVGLGCPKQDEFAAENADRINAVQLCVGAAFDFHAGVKPMAPAWMQRRGLEWLFRLASEPRRLWKRYLVTNTLFCLGVAKQLPAAIWRR